MTEIEQSKIKSIELEILKNVARFCDEHDIRYFLAFGTLLGAIRHSGFIPWDDDIDIAMPRADYDKFVSLYRKEKYQVLDYQIDNEFPYAFAKVIEPKTMLIEPTVHKYPLGVYIDIFPVDGLPESEKAIRQCIRFAKFLAKISLYKSIAREYPVDKKHRLLHCLAKALLLPISKKSIVKAQLKHARTFQYQNSAHVYIPSIYEGCKIMQKSWTDNLTLANFEGSVFKVPVEYDAYLANQYGEYMIPPPLSQRVSHHIFKANWIDNPNDNKSI